MNLTNNSNEMGTVVETFIIEETVSLIYDNEQLDKWNNLVNELGLVGQTSIIKPEKSPIPFMHMKQSLINVFKCLCPAQVNVKDYNLTPIPVEILDLIALSKRENYFQEIEIWYDDKSPDPVCIGKHGHWYQATWASDRNKELDYKEFISKEACEAAGATRNAIYFNETAKYLIGKWADVKHSFEELKEMATKRFIAEKSNEHHKIIKDSERALIDLETSAFDQFN